MKNRKWGTYILGTLLSLVALAAVGLAGFRFGMMQNGPFSQMAPFRQNMDKNDPNTPRADTQNENNVNPNGNTNSGNPRGNDFNPRGFDHGHRGMPMPGGFFGLIHLALLALLLWFGYKLAQKSGWRIVRVQQETPVAAEPVTGTPPEKESE